MTDEAQFLGAEVISLDGHREEIANSPIAQVEAYWEALRGTRLLPLRSEIDPRGIEGALEHTFLLERIAPGLARFRLAGTRINDLLGMEVRGMPLTSLLMPGSRDLAREALNMLFEGPKTVKIELASAGGIGRPALQAKLIMLPLKSDLGDVSRAIGCVAVSGKFGRRPRRFDIKSSAYSAIGPFKTPQPDPLPEKRETEVSGMSEDPTPFGNRSQDQRPKLRVITNNDLAADDN